MGAGGARAEKPPLGTMASSYAHAMERQALLPARLDGPAGLDNLQAKKNFSVSHLLDLEEAGDMVAAQGDEGGGEPGRSLLESPGLTSGSDTPQQDSKCGDSPVPPGERSRAGERRGRVGAERGAERDGVGAEHPSSLPPSLRPSVARPVGAGRSSELCTQRRGSVRGRKAEPPPCRAPLLPEPPAAGPCSRRAWGVGWDGTGQPVLKGRSRAAGKAHGLARYFPSAALCYGRAAEDWGEVGVRVPLPFPCSFRLKMRLGRRFRCGSGLAAAAAGSGAQPRTRGPFRVIPMRTLPPLRPGIGRAASERRKKREGKNENHDFRSFSLFFCFFFLSPLAGGRRK